MGAAKKYGDADITQGDGREARLLEYVLANAELGDAASVLAAIDAFASQSEWLMNVGDVKGEILDTEVTAAVARGARVFMEVGTYCGYSSVRIASRLPPGAKLYCVEVDARFAAIARAIQAHAGLQDVVEVLIGDCEAAIGVLSAHGVGPLDLVFIDHWKDLYVADFKRLRAAGMLPKDSVAVADNLIFPGAPDFIKLMDDHPDDFAFTKHLTKLEYFDDREDMVGVAVMRT